MTELSNDPKPVTRPDQRRHHRATAVSHHGRARPCPRISPATGVHPPFSRHVAAARVRLLPPPVQDLRHRPDQASPVLGGSLATSAQPRRLPRRPSARRPDQPALAQPTRSAMACTTWSACTARWSSPWARQATNTRGSARKSWTCAGKIVLRDGQGAFGNPSADSLRACVNETSRDILQVLFFHPEDPRQQAILSATLAAFNDFFTMAESRSFFI